MLQLVLDQNGNYEYKDVAPPKATPVLNNEFEAYESKQKTELAGDTNIGEQTKQLIRETPGQYTTSFNEETGQFETKTKGTEISPISVDTYPPLVVCVADTIGTLFSTARPLNSSAIDLISV